MSLMSTKAFAKKKGISVANLRKHIRNGSVHPPPGWFGNAVYVIDSDAVIIPKKRGRKPKDKNK